MVRMRVNKKNMCLLSASCYGRDDEMFECARGVCERCRCLTSATFSIKPNSRSASDLPRTSRDPWVQASVYVICLTWRLCIYYVCMYTLQCVSMSMPAYSRYTSLSLLRVVFAVTIYIRKPTVKSQELWTARTWEALRRHVCTWSSPKLGEVPNTRPQHLYELSRVFIDIHGRVDVRVYACLCVAVRNECRLVSSLGEFPVSESMSLWVRDRQHICGLLDVPEARVHRCVVLWVGEEIIGSMVLWGEIRGCMIM